MYRNAIQYSFSKILIAVTGSQVSDVLILITHQIGEYSMIKVISSSPLLKFLIRLYLRSIYFECLHAVPKVLIHVVRARNPNHGGVEEGHKLLYPLVGVSVGVYRHKHRLQVEVLTLVRLPHTFHRLTEFGEGVGADVGAVREPKVYQVVAAEQILARELLALRVHQLPPAPDLGLARISGAAIRLLALFRLGFYHRRLHLDVDVGEDETQKTSRQHIVTCLRTLHWPLVRIPLLLHLFVRKVLLLLEIRLLLTKSVPQCTSAHNNPAKHPS